MLRIHRLVDNLAAMAKIEQQMRNFLLDGQFSHFKHLRSPRDHFKPHADVLRDIYTALQSKLKTAGKEV